MSKIAIVRIRGSIHLKSDVLETLRRLRLFKQNYCVVFEDTPVIRGMVKKVKDYVTWGTISDDVFQLLVSKKGEVFAGRQQDSKGKITYRKHMTVDGKTYKNYFRLSPPRNGFGRRGIKMPFHLGGALGDRKEAIKDLIERMVE